MIRAFKSSVKRYANQNNITFECQPGFHDHIIRNEKEFYAIWRYIRDNPVKWQLETWYTPTSVVQEDHPA